MSDRSAIHPRVKGHRLFAATYDFFTQGSERKLMGHLRQLIVGEATGQVLEIGAGTGANFPYYKNAEQVVATEPDPFMLQRAKKRAERLGLDIEFYDYPAEELIFHDSSFDTVVSTLVLCTVADLDRTLAEIRRVLKPDGLFRFIEHVKAQKGVTPVVQDVLAPAWRQLAAGCNLNRRTAESIEAAGFEFVDFQQRSLPLLPLIFGIAKRRLAPRACYELTLSSGAARCNIKKTKATKCRPTRVV